MKKAVVLLTVAVGLLAWGCAKFEAENPGLKDSLEKSIADLNRAVNTISETRGYQVLIENTTGTKSGFEFSDSITLEQVAGIYDFAPDLNHHHDFFIPYRLFERTGDSDSMIVNLPRELVFRPMRLHNYRLYDQSLVNDFTIMAYDYHYYFSHEFGFDYSLGAAFTLDSDPIGTLEVVSQGGGEQDRSYSSTYTFEEGYNVSVSYLAGDSAVSTFSLREGDDILLSETLVRIREDYHTRERTYILTIGNIEIVRGTGIDSIQVYLDGVLQQEAGAVITDCTWSDCSICHCRDILLTFDDGTTVKLSELIGPARELLATLVDSLRSMNFATRVVNHIAIGIYYHNYFARD